MPDSSFGFGRREPFPRSPALSRQEIRTLSTPLGSAQRPPATRSVSSVPPAAQTDRELTVDAEAERLVDTLRSWGPLTVAFSGGVDSSVVAAAAFRADPEGAVAVTAESPSVPEWQLQAARQVAAKIGIRHQLVTTDEGTKPDYQRNDLRRCFHCKQTLYAALRSLPTASASTIVSGTNADDLGDYRPGIEAAGVAGVRAPLAELGITKSRVRAIAEYFQLPNAKLPASPCLASRIAYGVEVTPERLRRIESAEAWVRSQGFSDVRVRMHPDELARVEVPVDELAALVESTMLARLDERLRAAGFRFVTVDAQGFRSGNLNPPLVSLTSTRTVRSTHEGHDR